MLAGKYELISKKTDGILISFSGVGTSNKSFKNKFFDLLKEQDESETINEVNSIYSVGNFELL